MTDKFQFTSILFLLNAIVNNSVINIGGEYNGENGFNF